MGTIHSGSVDYENEETKEEEEEEEAEEKEEEKGETYVRMWSRQQEKSRLMAA